MKRPREGPPPTPSLFPHEVRRRSIVTLLCIFSRQRREQPDSAMAHVPREIMRMICGWVRADFTSTLVDPRGLEWQLLLRDTTYGDAWSEFLPETKFPYLWVCGQFLGKVAACPICLSFMSRTGYATYWGWECYHDDFPIIVDSPLTKLKSKYILP